MAEQSSPELRIAESADAPAIARLNLLFNGCSEPAEHYAARLVDPRRVDTPLLALVAGIAVGMANLRLLAPVFYPEPYAELTELYVEEAYRRQGLGRALVEYAERLARQVGAEEIFILTGAGNAGAQAFYRTLGYQADDIAFSKNLKSGQYD